MSAIIVELTLTREQFDRGYLIWGGACCTCHPYQLVRELADGRLLVRGCPSQEPTCQIEESIADSARKAWKMYGHRPVPAGKDLAKAIRRQALLERWEKKQGANGD